MGSRYVIAAVLAAGLLSAVTSPVAAAMHNVNVASFAFSPTKTHVFPGDTVRWVWVSGIHTTTSDAGPTKSWNSPSLSGAGQHFDVVFNFADSPGPFPYHCSIHLSMQDTIFVDYAPTVHRVNVVDFAFTPPNTHVNHGDTVLWVWQSGMHTTTSDPSPPKSWTSPTMAAPGNIFSIVVAAGDGAGLPRTIANFIQ